MKEESKQIEASSNLEHLLFNSELCSWALSVSQTALGKVILLLGSKSVQFEPVCEVQTGRTGEWNHIVTVCCPGCSQLAEMKVVSKACMHRGESGRLNSSSVYHRLPVDPQENNVISLLPTSAREGVISYLTKELWILRRGWSTQMWMWLQVLSSSHGFWLYILLPELAWSSLSHIRDAAGLTSCWPVCSPLSWFLSRTLRWGLLALGDHDKGNFNKAFLIVGFWKVPQKVPLPVPVRYW